MGNNLIAIYQFTAKQSFDSNGITRVSTQWSGWRSIANWKYHFKLLGKFIDLYKIWAIYLAEMVETKFMEFDIKIFFVQKGFLEKIILEEKNWVVLCIHIPIYRRKTNAR